MNLKNLFIYLCNHHSDQNREHFHHSRRVLCASLVNLIFPYEEVTILILVYFAYS